MSLTAEGIRAASSRVNRGFSFRRCNLSFGSDSPWTGCKVHTGVEGSPVRWPRPLKTERCGPCARSCQRAQPGSERTPRTRGRRRQMGSRWLEETAPERRRERQCVFIAPHVPRRGRTTTGVGSKFPKNLFTAIHSPFPHFPTAPRSPLPAPR